MKIKMYLPVIVIILTIMSCAKDDVVSNYNQRIDEIIMSRYGVLTRKLEFLYDADKVKQVNIYYKTETGWATDYVSYFTYEGNQVFHERYYIKEGNYKYKFRNIFTIENGRMVEDIFYIGAGNEWILSLKSDFNYTNDRLVNWISYRSDQGKWIERAGGNYIYQQALLQEYIGYEISEEMELVVDHDTFMWDSGNMVEYQDFNRGNLDLVLNSKSLYTYTDDRVSKIDIFAYDDGDWRPYLSQSFDYTSENRLLREMSTRGIETSFVYEAGNGNISEFYHIPTEDMYFRPTFKDAAIIDEFESQLFLPDELFDPLITAFLN